MASVTALKVGKLIDGNGGPVAENATILIEGKRIKAVGSASRALAVPLDATVIDEPTLTAIPGMMDSHTSISACSTT